MKVPKIQLYQMIMRVYDFAVQHLSQFPKGSSAAEILAAIGSIRMKLTHLLSAQVSDRSAVRSISNRKSAARKVLEARLRKIDRTALVLNIDSIRWTRAGTDQSLLDTGRSFATNLAPLKEQFIRQGLPEGFIEDLNVAVSDLERVISSLTEARGAGSGTIRDFNATLTEALKLVKQFEGLVSNTMAGDPVVMAAWDAARRIARSGKSKAVPQTVSDSKPQASSDSKPQTSDPPPIAAASPA
jgi:hypothetical protein